MDPIVDRADWRAASICQSVAYIAWALGGAKGEAPKVSSFLLKWEDPTEVEEQDPETIETRIRQWAEAYNKRWKAKHGDMTLEEFIKQDTEPKQKPIRRRKAS